MTADSFAMKFFLPQLAYAAPMLVAYFVGIAIAAARYRRHRRAATLVIAALATMFVVALGAPLIQGVMLYQYQGNTLAAIPYMQAVVITATVLKAGAVVLLAVAVFVGRTPPQPADE